MLFKCVLYKRNSRETKHKGSHYKYREMSFETETLPSQEFRRSWKMDQCSIPFCYSFYCLHWRSWRASLDFRISCLFKFTWESIPSWRELLSIVESWECLGDSTTPLFHIRNLQLNVKKKQLDSAMNLLSYRLTIWLTERLFDRKLKIALFASWLKWAKLLIC